MAILINRKYSSRIECLLYILQTTYKNFGENDFIISDIKFDPSKEFNVFDFCNLKHSNFGIEYCPFLDNSLNESKCYATQSVISDTTKSKAASATVRAFEALGFVEITNANSFVISEKGKHLCSLDFASKEYFDVTQKAILSYGPINAFLLNAYQIGPIFNSSDLYVSYPITEEPIELSTSSTKDSNTRTVSMLVSWCLQAGLIEPEKNRNKNNELPQIYYRKIINNKRLSCRKFILTDFAINYINSNPYVENPLCYEALNKNVGSLRENNSTDIRNITLQYNSIVLNRRFALIYILNYAKLHSINISFEKLHDILTQYNETFFLPNSDTWDILQSELNICPLAGLMIIVSEDKINILNNVNTEILSSNAPSDIVDLCKEIVKKI